MHVAESDAKLAVTRGEARLKSEMVNVDTDAAVKEQTAVRAAVKEQAAVRAAQVKTNEREAKVQRLRAARRG